MWNAVSRDVKRLATGQNLQTLFATPIWDDDTPDWAANGRDELYAWLSAPEWDFWKRWYDALLRGHPLNWDLQTEIALIPDADWKKGPAHIATLITEIEARHLTTATPLAETLAIDPDTGTLTVTPISMANEALFQNAKDKVWDAIDDLRPDGELAQHHFALTGVTARLDRTKSRYSRNPQRVHDDFLLAAKQVELWLDLVSGRFE